jgi:hypothetical protein
MIWTPHHLDLYDMATIYAEEYYVIQVGFFLCKYNVNMCISLYIDIGK